MSNLDAIPYQDFADRVCLDDSPITTDVEQAAAVLGLDLTDPVVRQAVTVGMIVTAKVLSKQNVDDAQEALERSLEDRASTTDVFRAYFAS